MTAPKAWNGGSFESAMELARERRKQMIAQGASVCERCAGEGDDKAGGLCLECLGAGCRIPSKGLALDSTRPLGSNADEWAAWLEAFEGYGPSFIAVQIAEAMDASEERSRLLDRMQTDRFLWVDAEHAVKVGGRFDGWLMWKHPDGEWVSVRKLKQDRT